MATPNPPLRATGYIDDAVAWNALLVDAADHIPDCLWPTSIETYRQMRTHAPLAAILGAYTLPLRRSAWSLNPSGCRPEVVRLVTDDLGLPVAGDDQPGAARVRGVSWPEHLRLALLCLPYGHSAFEMLAEIRDSRARLIELSERLPSTIAEFHTDKVGRLTGITQDLVPGRTAPQIKVDRLVLYSREREGTAYWGRSLLRPAYPAWLLSREMLKVAAISNRRWGAGVPNMRALPGTTPSPGQMTEALQLASQARAGDQSGAVTPPGFMLEILGLSGGVPDTVGFLRYLDQQMAQSALAGFLNLGTTETGSRALASEFIDLFTLSIQSEADAVADTATRQAAARVVEWNWGVDEPVPAVQVADVGAKHEITAESLQLLLSSGALTADPALEAHLRRMYHLPERDGMPMPAPSVRGDTVAAANPPRKRATKRAPADNQMALDL